jgi:hypothetical protein
MRPTDGMVGLVNEPDKPASIQSARDARTKNRCRMRSIKRPAKLGAKCSIHRWRPQTIPPPVVEHVFSLICAKSGYPTTFEPVDRVLRQFDLIHGASPLLSRQGPGRRTQTARLAARRMVRTSVEFAQGFEYLVDGDGRLETVRCPHRGTGSDRRCIGRPRRQNGALLGYRQR